MTALANTALCQIGGRRGWKKGRELGVKTNIEYLKINLCRLSRVTDWYRENSVLKIKANTTANNLTHTPKKQQKKTKK